MQKEYKGAAWALGLWGALSIIFGLLVVAWPGITLKVFLLFLGIYLLAGGVVMLIGSLVNHTGHWIGGALIGLLGVVAGLYVFAHPEISALVVLTVMALWAIAIGMLQIAAGFSGKNDWWMIIGGVIYTLFGFWVFANPAGGALAIIWLIGLTTIIGGIVIAVAAFKTAEEGKKLAK
jgi:uncharacterized membrane protein HdeD (DUF308 family)